MSLADTLALLDDTHARLRHMLAECPPRRRRHDDPPLDGLGYGSTVPMPAAPRGIAHGVPGSIAVRGGEQTGPVAGDAAMACTRGAA